MTLHENIIQDLWDIIDDIDTFDDACRDNDANFRNLVRTKIKQRWLTGISVSKDGLLLRIPKNID